MRSPLRCRTSTIRSSTLVQASSSLSMVRIEAWPPSSLHQKIYFRHFPARVSVLYIYIYIYVRIYINMHICVSVVMLCERCLLITESPKTPGHFRYLIWVLCLSGNTQPIICKYLDCKFKDLEVITISLSKLTNMVMHTKFYFD